MATVYKNLSEYDKENIKNGADLKIGIVVSEWNSNITNNLLEGAKKTLLENGVKEENIHILHVPGAFELPLAGQWLLQKETIDGIIAIGSVIQGETKHFDFVCEAASSGIKEIGLKYNKPALFCVLTDNTMQQAIDRSGGKHGNKGIECAVACLQMVHLQKALNK